MHTAWMNLQSLEIRDIILDAPERKRELEKGNRKRERGREMKEKEKRERERKAGGGACRSCYCTSGLLHTEWLIAVGLLAVALQFKCKQ